MRKLPFLLVLLLLSLMLLAAAASAKAATLPPAAGPAATFAGAADEEETEGEDESAADENEGGEAEEEGEDCGAEEDELCEEEGEDGEAEECVLEDATASVAVAPGADQVRLTIRYDSLEPTAVLVDSRLRGGKGGLHLGSDRARFGRNGVYRDSFDLGAKQMGKALAAREFEIDLRAVGTPAGCDLQLATRAPHRAK